MAWSYQRVQGSSNSFRVVVFVNTHSFFSQLCLNNRKLILGSTKRHLSSSVQIKELIPLRHCCVNDDDIINWAIFIIRHTDLFVNISCWSAQFVSIWTSFCQRIRSYQIDKIRLWSSCANHKAIKLLNLCRRSRIYVDTPWIGLIRITVSIIQSVKIEGISWIIAITTWGCTWPDSFDNGCISRISCASFSLGIKICYEFSFPIMLEVFDHHLFLAYSRFYTIYDKCYCKS